MTKLKAIITCEATFPGCPTKTTEDCTCEVEARIESGGSVEIKLVPDLPVGWTFDRYGYYCPRCSETHRPK